jgi:indole-3-glycerol phosphate synthase
MTILDEIAIKTRLRIEEEKKKKSLEELKAEVEKLPVSSKFLFKKALMKKDISFICEVKKASPSKGIIAEDFPYIQIAKDYEKAGADALSVLTETYYFKGSNEYLKKIRKNVNIPILRKDFTIDEYMIYEAKLMGADAVLLICAILSESELKRYMELARSLGLSALVEAHDEQEIGMALASRAEIIGVNNRNLKDFTVDINNSIRLRKLVREEIVFVSESGIKTAEDIDNLRKNGTNAVLIGETLMRSEDKKSELDKLRGRR